MALVLREDFDATQLRLYARQSDDADQVRRLLALAAIYDGASRAEAAEIGGVTRQIVRDWVERPEHRRSGRTGCPQGSGQVAAADPRSTGSPGPGGQGRPYACHRWRGALALGRSGAVSMGPVFSQHLAPNAGSRAAGHAVSQAVGPTTPPRAGRGRGGRF